MPLAVIPLVFSIQQFCEGWVWTGINHSNHQLLTTSSLAFLFFALLFWPAWIPFSTLYVETRKKIRTCLWVITLLGAALGSALYFPVLLAPDRLAVRAVQHSVHYNIDASPVVNLIPGLVWQLVYLVSVSVPLFFSPLRRVLHFGMAIVLSAAISHVFFEYAAASIWCFFAAGLSLYLASLFFKLPAPIPATAST
jgi:hypothetical protein